MTDYNTLQKKRNMAVGAFVIIACIAFVWMVVRFGELPLLFTKHKSFFIFAQFPTAPGIQKNTPVKYCGYQIGKVFRVDPPAPLIHSDTGKPINQVKVGMAIEKKFEYMIPNSIDIRVMKRSMGSGYIELIDMPGEPTEFINAQTPVLQGDIGSSTEFIPRDVQDKLEHLVDNINIVANDIHTIFGDRENQENVKLTINNFKRTIDQADETLKSIQTFTESGQNSLDTVAEELGQTLKQIRIILESVNQGDGTVGKLINDPTLHENLVEATIELQMAIDQIKQFIVETRQKGINVDLF